MKKHYIIAVIGIIGLSAAGYWAWRDHTTTNNNASPQTIVGNDRDKHGCISSAGYAWNEEREECIRPWELPVITEAEQAVQEQLAQKYQKSSLSVQVTKIDGNHVAGSIHFVPGAAGGSFLAFKEGGTWNVVYDGNGSIDCNDIRQQYGFSDLVLVPQFCEAGR